MQPSLIADRSVALHPGQEPIAGFRLVRRRGRGGFGEVWEAAGPGGFPVALKFVRVAEQPRSTELRALDFVREIHHPNLLTNFGAWLVQGVLVIGMELADQSLWDRFLAASRQGYRGIPRAELLGYLTDVAAGIDHLNGYRHTVDGRSSVGIQHRDLKPPNILLFGGGAKVGDLGMARVMEGEVAAHTGAWTFPYAAPEFFRGETTRQSDQYGLAATYCQLRGGRLPFSGSAATITAGHLFGRPDLDALPEAEQAIVARALAKDPAERWPDCRAFVAALRALEPDAAAEILLDPDESSSDHDEVASWEGHSFTDWPSLTTNHQGSSKGAWPAHSRWLLDSSNPGLPAQGASATTLILAGGELEVPQRGGALEATPRWWRWLALATAATLLGTTVGSRPDLGRSDANPGPVAVAVATPPPEPPVPTASRPPRLEPTPAVLLGAPSTGFGLASSLEPSRPALEASSDSALLPSPPLAPVLKLAQPVISLVSRPIEPPLEGPLTESTTAAEPSARRPPVDAAIQPALAPAAPAPVEVVAGPARAEPVDREPPVTTLDPIPNPSSAPVPAPSPVAAEVAPAPPASNPSPSPSPSPDLNPAQAAFGRGREAFLQRAFARATAEFSESLRLNPTHTTSQLLRGVARHRGGDPRGALADYDAVLRARPGDATTTVSRGQAYYEIGDYTRAAADYTAAILLRPSDGDAHFRRGLARYQTGDYAGAVSDFDETLRLDRSHLYAAEFRVEALARRNAQAARPAAVAPIINSPLTMPRPGLIPATTLAGPAPTATAPTSPGNPPPRSAQQPANPPDQRRGLVRRLVPWPFARGR